MFHRCLSQCSLCALLSPTLTNSPKRLISQSASLMRQYKRTHYEVLGLSTGASQSEIRDAFVKLSKEVHPDMNPDDPDNHAKFVQVNEAYTVLSKLGTRREYDINIAYMTRTTAASHTAGQSYSPGSGVQPGGGDSAYYEPEKPFWDESIWEMRDRTKDKDAFYARDSYYGIRGVRRQSNEVVAACIVAVLGFGAIIHFFFGYWLSTKANRTSYEKVDKKNLRILKEVELRARQNGTPQQLEILKARADIEAAKLRARARAGTAGVKTSATEAAAAAAASVSAAAASVSAAPAAVADS